MEPKYFVNRLQALQSQREQVKQGFISMMMPKEFINAAQALTGIAPGKYEEPQVVRYQPGNN